MLRILIPPGGKDLSFWKTSKFYMSEHGIFEKDFLPPKDMLQILIPPRVSKNDFLGNAKIMPLLTTRGFSFFASFRCLPQLDCSRIKECSNYEEIIYFTADERKDR